MLSPISFLVSIHLSIRPVSAFNPFGYFLPAVYLRNVRRSLLGYLHNQSEVCRRWKHMQTYCWHIQCHDRIVFSSSPKSRSRTKRLARFKATSWRFWSAIGYYRGRWNVRASLFEIVKNRKIRDTVVGHTGKLGPINEITFAWSSRLSAPKLIVCVVGRCTRRRAIHTK